MISNYNRHCKSTIGDIKRIYLAGFVKYSLREVMTNENELIAFPDTSVATMEINGNFTQSSSIENGSYAYTQTITILIPSVYSEFDVSSFRKANFRLIAETNNGDLVLFGLRNGLRATVSNSSGEEKTDFNGFTITFDGLEDEIAPYITTLGDYFYPYEDVDIFNYNLINGQ